MSAHALSILSNQSILSIQRTPAIFKFSNCTHAFR